MTIGRLVSIRVACSAGGAVRPGMRIHDLLARSTLWLFDTPATTRHRVVECCAGSFDVGTGALVACGTRSATSLCRMCVALAPIHALVLGVEAVSAKRNECSCGIVRDLRCAAEGRGTTTKARATTRAARAFQSAIVARGAVAMAVEA